jgi:hypothetical protein
MRGIGKSRLDLGVLRFLNGNVRSWLFAVIGLLVCAAVLYVCLCPAVDLDPTITRAYRLAMLLLIALAYLGQVLAGVLAATPYSTPRQWTASPTGPPPGGSPCTGLDCSHLC